MQLSEKSLFSTLASTMGSGVCVMDYFHFHPNYLINNITILSEKVSFVPCLHPRDAKNASWLVALCTTFLLINSFAIMEK